MKEYVQPYENRRDRGLANERVRLTYKSLRKHIVENDEKLSGFDCWGWIPKSVFDLTLSSQAYGLLVILVMNTTIPPIANGRKVIPRITETTVLRWLGLTNSNRRPLITRLLDELVEADIIKRYGEEIEILFPSIKEVKGGFSKIYTSTYKAILNQSHGITTLNRLAVYLGIRSQIFEGEKGGPHRTVVYKGYKNEWIGGLVDLPPATVRNNVRWLIEHEIMAWNMVQNRNKYHNLHYYLAEQFNCDELLSTVCMELQDGDLLRVVS